MWWWILIPVVLVLGVFLYNGRNRQNTEKRENPVNILDNRFAKGEIFKKEYEEIKRDIDSKK
jgi:putative membrane protein